MLQWCLLRLRQQVPPSVNYRIWCEKTLRTQHRHRHPKAGLEHKETVIKKRSCALHEYIRLPSHPRSQRRPRIVEARTACDMGGMGRDADIPAVKVAAFHLSLIRKEASVHTHLFPASIRTKPLSVRPSAVGAAQSFISAVHLRTRQNRTIICRCL